MKRQQRNKMGIISCEKRTCSFTISSIAAFNKWAENVKETSLENTSASGTKRKLPEEIEDTRSIKSPRMSNENLLFNPQANKPSEETNEWDNADNFGKLRIILNHITGLNENTVTIQGKFAEQIFKYLRDNRFVGNFFSKIDMGIISYEGEGKKHEVSTYFLTVKPQTFTLWYQKAHQNVSAMLEYQNSLVNSTTNTPTNSEPVKQAKEPEVKQAKEPEEDKDLTDFLDFIDQNPPPQGKNQL